MKDCWHENPENRPDFTQIRNRLKKLRQGKKTNIMDQMIEQMDKYTQNESEMNRLEDQRKALDEKAEELRTKSSELGTSFISLFIL